MLRVAAIGAGCKMPICTHTGRRTFPLVDDHHISARVWLYPHVGNDTVYVELRHVLGNLEIQKAAWTWIAKKELWLGERPARRLLGNHAVLRSRRSEHVKG